MSPAEARALKQLSNRRVRITFTDGQEVLATLIDLTTDADGSHHLLYDHVTWAKLPHNDIGAGAFYSSGDEVLRVTPAP